MKINNLKQVILFCSVLLIGIVIGQVADVSFSGRLEGYGYATDADASPSDATSSDATSSNATSSDSGFDYFNRDTHPSYIEDPVNVTNIEIYDQNEEDIRLKQFRVRIDCSTSFVYDFELTLDNGDGDSVVLRPAVEPRKGNNIYYVRSLDAMPNVEYGTYQPSSIIVYSYNDRNQFMTSTFNFTNDMKKINDFTFYTGYNVLINSETYSLDDVDYASDSDLATPNDLENSKEIEKEDVNFQSNKITVSLIIGGLVAVIIASTLTIVLVKNKKNKTIINSVPVENTDINQFNNQVLSDNNQTVHSDNNNDIK